MLEICIQSRAQWDIRNIHAYFDIVVNKPKVAVETVASIHEAIEKIADMPGMGSPLEAENLEHKYRRLLVGKYWVYYSEEDGKIIVWRIFHTSQEIDEFAIVDF